MTRAASFDELGNLSNWWTKEDRDKFVQKTKLIVKQFNGYTMLDSVHLNGDATQVRILPTLAA